MISLEDWALIRRLVAEGVPQRQVARDLGVARATVARAVASQGPPKYERPADVNSFTPVESRVRALLAEHPDLPATVIAERVGWTGSITWFRDNVRLLRPGYRRVDPADRLEHVAGDAAQCDLWFPAVKVPAGDGTSATFPVLVIVATYSRFITAVMLPTRTTADLLVGMWALIAEQLGAVPRRLVWDNEAGIGRGGRLAEGVGMFCGTLATRLVQCKPYDPESKGVVERANQYLETSFLPGRTFTSPDDFNTQLRQWLVRANGRTVRALGARPTDLLGADTAAMLPLPPVPPTIGWAWFGRLGRDYYVRLDANDYSVDPTFIGQLVDVTADLHHVRVRAGGRLVADHARAWGTAMTITDPAHLATARALRQAFQDRPASADPVQVPARDLADYDRAFAVDLDPVDLSVIDGRVA